MDTEADLFPLCEPSEGEKINARLEMKRKVFIIKVSLSGNLKAEGQVGYTLLISDWKSGVSSAADLLFKWTKSHFRTHNYQIANTERKFLSGRIGSKKSSRGQEGTTFLEYSCKATGINAHSLYRGAPGKVGLQGQRVAEIESS